MDYTKIYPVLIILLIGVIILLVLHDTKTVEDNKVIAGGYIQMQDYLISICKIDYNAYLQHERERYLIDANLRTRPFDITRSTVS